MNTNDEMKNSASCPSSFGDEEQIYLWRCKYLLEGVVNDLLLTALRYQWDQKNDCLACKSAHSFDDMKVNPCILELGNSFCNLHEAATMEKFTCLEAIRLAKNNSVAALEFGFDVVAKCQLLQGMCSAQNLPMLCKKSNIDLGIFCNWRCRTSHNYRMPRSDFTICFKEVSQQCYKLLTCMQKSKEEKLAVEASISNAKNFLDVLWIKECMLREYNQSCMHQLSSIVSLVQHGRASFDTAKCLLAEDTMKVLIIPKLKQTRRVERFHFLTKLTWTAIFDMNEPSLWNDNEREEFSTTIVNASDTNHNDVNFWFSSKPRKTLYSSDFFAVFNLLPADVAFEIFVAGFEKVDNSEKVLSKLDNAISLLTQMKSISCLSEIVDANDINAMLCSTNKCLGLDVTGKKICCIDILAAVVLGNRSEGNTILIRANGKVFGFPKSLAKSFYSSVELLQVGFNAPTEAVDEMMDPDESRKNEIKKFFSGGEAPWSLIKSHDLVRQVQMESIMKQIEDVESSSGPEACLFNLQHERSQGGTTLARQVLHDFALRGRVCMVVHSPIQCHHKFIAFLSQLHKVGGARILILIDIKPTDEGKQMAHLVNKLEEIEHVTILFTSQRTINSASRALKVRMDRTNENDVKKMKKLLKEVSCHGSVCIRNTIFPTNEFGYLDVEAIAKSRGHLDIVKSCSFNELRRSGVSPLDILDLKTIRPSEKTANAACSNSLNLENLTGMLFIGLVAFMPEYREGIRSKLLALVEHLSEVEKHLLRLCLFYGLFTPYDRVPNLLVDQERRRYSGKKQAQWTEGFRYFVQEDGNKNLFMRHSVLPYMCAEAPSMFGTRHDSLSESRPLCEDLYVDKAKLNAFAKGILHSVAHGAAGTKNVLSPSFTNIFCDFKTWHPGNPPFEIKREDGYLDNAFFTEMTLSLHSIESNRRLESVNLVRDNFNTLIDIYQKYRVQRVTFSTHLARLLAYEGQSLSDKSLLQDALRVLGDLGVCSSDSHYIDFYISDGFGNIYKRYVQHQMKRCVSGDQLQDQKKEAFKSAFEHTQSSYRHFQDAISSTRWMNPQPMIGAVQALYYFLQFMCNLFCGKDHDKCVRLLRAPSDDMWKEVSEYGIVERCHYLLSSAKNVSATRPNFDSSQAMFNGRSSMEYIKDYQDKLKLFTITMDERLSLRGPFVLSLAKHALLNSKSRPTPQELLYCVVTLTANINDSSNFREEKHYYQAHVDLFEASAKLASLYDDLLTENDFPEQLQDKVPPDDVKNAWNGSRLNGHMKVLTADMKKMRDQCANRSPIKSYFGIEAQICLVALLVWQITFDGYKIPEELISSLEQLWSMSEGCRRPIEILYLLRKSPVLWYNLEDECKVVKVQNPFSCFIDSKYAVFSSALEGARCAVEVNDVYVEQGRHYLHPFKGVIKGLYVFCQCFKTSIRFEQTLKDSLKLIDEQTVSFYLGITRRGLWAVGLRLCAK